MSTAGHGSASGSECTKCASAGRSRRRRSGTRTAMRSSWIARRQRDRLDSRRHELGAARDRGEAQAVADGGERAEQILDVRLVAGALPAEHVGVDHDERIAHAAPPRRPPGCVAAVSSHENARARSRPRARSSSRRRMRLLDPGGDRRDVERVDEDCRTARDLLRRAAGRRDDGRAARHRLEHRDAEALVQRRVDEAARAAVETRRARRRRPRRASVTCAPRASTPPQPRAPTTRSSTPSRARGLDRRARGSSAARACRPRARSRPPRAARPGVKTVVDGVRHDADLLARDAQERLELGGGELRDRDHARRRAQHARHDARHVRARPARKRVRDGEARRGRAP